MSNLETSDKAELGMVSLGFGSLESFEFTQRVAKMLSTSSLVPKEYQGNLPNCFIALNMAGRMDADAMMVMQNLHLINGRPSWSAQFLISTFNTCGKYSAIRYEWVGTPGQDDYGCRAWSIEKATGEKLEGSEVTITMAKKEGWYDKKDKFGNQISKWQTMPKQMLMYRSASFFIRAYAPEIGMGMHTDDEIIDMVQTVDGSYEQELSVEVEQNANKGVLDIDLKEAPEPAFVPQRDF